jgi:hypothetical protein
MNCEEPMKDLFLRVFAQLSRFDYGEYYRDFVCKAPIWILRSAGRAHEDVRTFPGFQALCAFLKERSCSCWNNPELYPHLHRVLRARDGQSDTSRTLKALEGHLGLREVSADLFTHRYFRRNRPLPATFELADGRVKEAPEAIIAKDPGFPLLYGPVPHLFDDVVGGRATYDGSPLPVSPDEIRRTVGDAERLLGRYDATLHNGFTEAVGSLAITGGWSLADRASYSSGSNYTGEIFTTLCPGAPTLLGESLIHEYYHQRLWLWWLIEAPSDLPGREVVMVSPVSGQERPVQVMMHALLIYMSLVDYYRWAERASDDLDGASIRRRWRTLEAGATELLAALRKALAERSASLRFVDAVAACAP